MRDRSVIGSKDEKAIQEFYKNARVNINQTIQSQKLALKERSDDLNKKLESKKSERKINTFPDFDLNKNITDLELEIYNLGKKAMGLNLKTQNQELNHEESNAISELRSKAKIDITNRIKELQREIEIITIEQDNLKSQKDNLVRKISNTTIGIKRKEIFDQNTSTEERINKDLTEEQTKLKKLIVEKQANLTSIVASHQIELFPIEEAHKKEIGNIDKKFEARKDEVETNRDKRIRDLNRRDSRMKEIKTEAPVLVKKISDFDAAMVEEGEKTLVGQWTHRIYNDVEPEHITIVAFVWFGSLAAITAWLGTLLAFAGLVLRYNHEKIYKPSRITRAIQRYFAVARACSQLMPVPVYSPPS